MDQKKGQGGGITRGVGTDIYSLLCIKYWTNENPLYSKEEKKGYSLFIGDIVNLKNALQYTVIHSVQLLSHVWLFLTPWTAAHQACLSITNSRSSLGLTSIESVMPSNHLILCCPLLLPPSIFPSIRVFSNESALHIRQPKDWGFSFKISWSSRCRQILFDCT